MGRPPLDPDQAKGQYIQLRLTAAERDEVQGRLRAGRGVSVGMDTWLPYAGR